MTRVQATAQIHTAAITQSNAEKLTGAFDKAFPWRTKAGATINDAQLPANAEVKKMPGEAGELLAAVTKNYSSVHGYRLVLGKQPVLAIIGKNDSDCGIALFTRRGKQIAFDDWLGLNQWQYDAKGNARNEALGAGLPGQPRVKPLPPLSAANQALADAFDKKYPWSDQNESVGIPDNLAVKDSALTRGTQLSRMAHSSYYDGGGTTTYKIELNGKNLYCCIGITDAVYDIGLFDLKGKRLAIDHGSGWTTA